MAVWGDDTSTPEIDGLSAGEAITFQLVDGNNLYVLDFVFGGINSYTTISFLPVLNADAILICSGYVDAQVEVVKCLHHF